MKKYIFSFLLFLITNFAFGQYTDNTPAVSGTETWIAPPGVTSVVVEAWGGGGGGSNANSYAGGGGSGGGYVRAVYTVVPGNSYTYRVGYGGDASNHGQSSFFIDANTINAVGGRSANSTAGATALTSGNKGGTLVSTYGGNGGNAGTAPSYLSGGGGSSAGFTNGNNAVGRYGGYAPVYGYDGANGVNAYYYGINGKNGRIGAGGSGGGYGVYRGYGGYGGDGQIRISYCVSGAPSFTSAHSSLYINKFQFVGMLNDNVYTPVISTYSTTGYENHTFITNIAKQPQGSVMNVEAYASASLDSNFGRWRAWVDWNKDGDFFDVGEEVYSMVNYNTPSITFGFAISSTQAVGTYKLRISTVKVGGYYEYFGPCQVSENLGEVEDHIFEVVSDCSAKVLSVNTVNEFDGERCGPGSVQLSAKGTTASAVSFNWYDYDENTKIYTKLGTGITFSTPPINATKTYYVKAITNTDNDTSAANYCETPFYYPVIARIDPKPTVSFSVSDPAICGEDKPSLLVTAMGDKYQDVIFEKFDSGLGVFTNTPTINTFYDNYGNDISSWKNSINSQVIPSDPPYEGLSPALSSGYFGGNFAMINSDLERPKTPDTGPYSILNYLTSNDLPVNGFNNLQLDFDIYHFSIATGISEGYFEVEYFDGSTWKSLKLPPDNTVTPNIPNLSAQPYRYYMNVGNPLKWYHVSVPIPGSNFTINNFKLRFTHFSKASASNSFKEAITTIDNVKLSGLKDIDTPFNWNSATTTIYDTNCTTALSGTDLKTTVCVKPSATELEDVNWTLNANATFSNGCDAIGSFVVNNDTKTWKQPSNTITDWNLDAQWKPLNVPDINKCVIVRTPVELPTNTNGSHGFARSVIVKPGGSLIIQPKSSLTIQNHIKNETAPSDVLVKSDANLIQFNDADTNSGNITVQRNSKMKRLDYTYWGSPVSGQKLRSFSPATLNTRFYVYNEANDYFDGIFVKNTYPTDGLYPTPTPSLTPVQPEASYDFEKAKGYAVRSPNNFTTSVSDFMGNFVGTPNNGVFTININKSKNTDIGGNTYKHGINLISNPYPSNIDLDKFFAANPSLEKVARFWTNINPNPAMQGSGYPNGGFINNYAFYNIVGGLPAPGPACEASLSKCSPIPTKIVKVGQGFLVHVASSVAPGTNNIPITFNNSIRSATNSGSFFNGKIANATKDRYWLELKTPLDFVTPLLVGYVEGSTNAYDEDYDVELNVIGADSFYTILDNKKLGIQGRKYPVNTKDVVSLGAIFHETGMYMISLTNKEGVFANGQQIYLRDNLLGVVANLSQGAYSFSAQAGEVNNRFEILYNYRSLGTDTIDKAGFTVYKEGNDFVIKANETIRAIKIYDASGKLIYKFNANSKEHRVDATKYQSGVYMIDITTSSKSYNKKIIK